MRFLTTTLILGLLAFVPAIGADVPRPTGELEITTLAGKTVTIEDLAGKSVLVMYFSTDCSHCQRTATVMAPIYQEYSAKGVEFIGVTLNPTAKDNLGSFIEKYAVAFPVGLGNRQHFSQFSGLSVMERFYYPYLLFVDKDGQIQEEHQGAERGYFADLNASLRQSLDRLLGGS